MATDLAAHLRDAEDFELVFLAPTQNKTARPAPVRRHVLNRLMQEKSGRLYCADDWDFDIPNLEIYAAR